MLFRITGDTDVESGVSEVVEDLSGPARQYFQSHNYGADLVGIGVILMCQDPNLKLKRRVRFAKKEKKLYMDIMLDLDEMKSATPLSRRNMIVKRISEEVPAVLSKYKIADFDFNSFKSDIEEWEKQSTIKSG